MSAVRTPYIRGGKVGSVGGGGFSTQHKGLFLLAAVLIGPAALKRLYDTPAEKVDLSAWKMVSHYDTPAIERRDSVVRVEFCAS